jgi:cellulose synthase/poly-beta-1,6-N-acetylglucosamine synthase-like glycosyltransferase
VPLGGTSNHFPRATLVDIGAWDPFNVTEDADLGMRIARLGYQTGVLASTTWEEAPPVFRVWLTQRTRWLKGWMRPVKPVQKHRIINDLTNFGLSNSWLSQRCRNNSPRGQPAACVWKLKLRT